MNYQNYELELQIQQRIRDRRNGQAPTESSVLKMAQLCQQHPGVYGPWVKTLGGR
jgi:hypothetical protein